MVVSCDLSKEKKLNIVGIFLAYVYSQYQKNESNVEVFCLLIFLSSCLSITCDDDKKKWQTESMFQHVYRRTFFVVSCTHLLSVVNFIGAFSLMLFAVAVIVVVAW